MIQDKARLTHEFIPGISNSNSKGTAIRMVLEKSKSCQEQCFPQPKERSRTIVKKKLKNSTGQKGEEIGPLNRR